MIYNEMNEFYAEEMGLDYGEVCYQDQLRHSINKETLSEVLGLEILQCEIDFKNEIIEYWYICSHDEIVETEENDYITINDFHRLSFTK